MWYAVTARPVKLKSKEKRKEFFRGEIEVIVNAETRDKLEEKLKATCKKYPKETSKYLRAGIKFVEASNIIQAKRKSREVGTYFDHTGQYKLF